MNNAKGVIAYLALAFGLARALWEIPIRMGFAPTTSVLSLRRRVKFYSRSLAAS